MTPPTPSRAARELVIAFLPFSVLATRRASFVSMYLRSREQSSFSTEWHGRR
ncbi:hypothetical protein BC628DRAFT_1368907 [Trametes gibbosa]|nr:hypothetical protein BC628DRAFT_1368907 [Trametes gibbosa]